MSGDRDSWDTVIGGIPIAFDMAGDGLAKFVTKGRLGSDKTLVLSLTREQLRGLGAWALRAAGPEPPPEDADGDVIAEAIDRERASARAATSVVPVCESFLAEVEEVCAALEARRAFGLAKYGKPLQRGNGRDHLRDSLDELLDAMAYAHAADDWDLYDSARRAVVVAIRKTQAKEVK